MLQSRDGDVAPVRASRYCSRIAVRPGTVALVGAGGDVVAGNPSLQGRLRDIVSEGIAAMRAAAVESRDFEMKHSRATDKSYHAEYEEKYGAAVKQVADALTHGKGVLHVLSDLGGLHEVARDPRQVDGDAQRGQLLGKRVLAWRRWQCNRFGQGVQQLFAQQAARPQFTTQGGRLTVTPGSVTPPDAKASTT